MDKKEIKTIMKAFDINSLKFDGKFIESYIEYTIDLHKNIEDGKPFTKEELMKSDYLLRRINWYFNLLTMESKSAEFEGRQLLREGNINNKDLKQHLIEEKIIKEEE